MPITEEDLAGYPTGWFAVAFTGQVKRGKLFTSRLAGEDVVVYRTPDGSPRVIRPYCPHQGAHLGYGGRIEGGELVCPFHAFRFDADGGVCTRAYEGAPPRVRLTHLPAAEGNGLVFAWYSPVDAPPAWKIHSLPDDGFGAPINWTATYSGHMLNGFENAIDYRHLPVVHGAVPGPLPSGELIETDYRTFFMESVMYLTEFQVKGIRVTFNIRCDGLGQMTVTMYVPQLRLRLRECAGWTPVDPGRFTIREASFNRFDLPPGRLHPARGLAALGRPVLARLMERGLVRQGYKDIRIWSHCKFLEHPGLAQDDSPIMEGRRWAKRFYDPERIAALAASLGGDDDLRDHAALLDGADRLDCPAAAVAAPRSLPAQGGG